MKLQLSSLIVIFFLFGSFAQAKWIVNSYRGKDVPENVRSFSVVQKVMESNQGPFVTGTITNSVIEINAIQNQKHQPLDPDAMAEQIRTSLRTDPWVKEKLEGLHFYTLKWKEERRYLRLIIQKDKTVFRISFANLRQPYVFQESLEADLLQRAFFRIDKKNAKTASYWPLLWRDMVPEAQASSFSTADLQRAYQGFLSSLDQIAKNVGYNSAKELAGALQGMGANLQSSVQVGSASINNLADSVRSTFNFMNGVKFGAGMGFGFATASAVANLAIDQGAKVLRDAYYALTGTMKKEERAMLDARVGKALDAWTQETEKLQEVEKNLSVYEMAFTGAFLLPPERALNSKVKAQERQIDLKSQIKALEEKLLTMQGEDRALCIAQMNDLENQLAFTNAVLEKMADGNDSKEKMCQQMANLLDQWSASEASLHQAKMIISVERTTILGQFEKQQLEALKDPVSTRVRENECQSIRKKLADAEEEKYQSNQCSSKPGDANCAIIQRHVEEWKKAISDCSTDVAKGQMGFSERDVARMGEALLQHRSNAIRGLDSIAASDCDEKDRSGPCKGQVGLLADVKKTYEAKASMVRQHCPQLNLKAPLQNFSKASYQEGYPNPEKDRASLLSSSDNKKSSGGFFSSIGSFLKRIWNAIF